MDKYIINPNDVNSEGVAVDLYNENGKCKHGAFMRIIHKNDSGDPDDKFGLLQLEKAYEIVFALNLGMQQLEKLK